MNKPKDIIELRDRLLDVFEQVTTDPRRVAQAKESANVAGKIIATCMAQIEYASLRGQEPDIPFMGPTNGRQVPRLKSPPKAINMGNIAASKQ